MPGDPISQPRLRATARSGPPAIFAAAIALSLLLLATSRPVSSQASAESPEHQSLTAEVSSEVSWGSADRCRQNIQTDDFGQLTPASRTLSLGAFAALPATTASVAPSGAHVWVGCVTSNAPLASVVAQGTANMSDGAGNVLPIADVAIGVTNQPAGATPGSCAIASDQAQAGSCALPVDDTIVRTLVGEAPPGTTELNWQYQLNLPANQPVGSYQGGQLVFTATAADPSAAELSSPPEESSCDVTWTGAAGADNWNEPRNWSTGATPTGTQHVCILDSATVNANGESDQAGSLTDTGELLLTGMLAIHGSSTSTVNQLTISMPPSGVSDDQGLQVASQLDVERGLTWSSYIAAFLGPGAIVLDPRSSSTFSGTAPARLPGGRIINEGIVTWESGGITAEGDTGVFFVNRGEFRADQNGNDPIVYGCRAITELGYVVGYRCPIFQNYGTITGIFPVAEDLPYVQHTWVEWEVTIENYGQLDVPYEQDPNCWWGGPEPTQRYFECQAAIDIYKGLVLNEGAQVINK